MNIGLTELYVNLKNWDFDINGKYEMDLKESQKYMYAYNCQKECEEKKKAEYEQKLCKSAEVVERVGEITDRISSVIDTIIGNEVLPECTKCDASKLIELRDELYNIMADMQEGTDGKEEEKEE